MKKIILISFIVAGSLLASSQDSIFKPAKLLKIWVYTGDNTELKGVFSGASDSMLFVYEGTIDAYNKQASHKTISIDYKNIRIIKIKKRGGLLKGLLIGAVIGLAPAFFGEGGAYAAVITLPVGIITGAIIGATAKKKYAINGGERAFRQFIEKYK
jgi:hypothetical protein